MAGIFEKLNLKDQQEILVLRAPDSFLPELARLSMLHLHRHIESLKQIDFLLAFVTRKSEVDALAPPVAARAQGDAVVWFAYPKGTSKRYSCDFNRDTGWDALKAAGLRHGPRRGHRRGLERAALPPHRVHQASLIASLYTKTGVPTLAFVRRLGRPFCCSFSFRLPRRSICEQGTQINPRCLRTADGPLTQSWRKD